MSDRVSVAYVHSEQVAYSWFRSITGLITYDRANKRHVVGNPFVDIMFASGGISDARNKAVREFLTTDSDWLFWIDTDMGFEPDIVDRLLDVADPVERPIRPVSDQHVASLLGTWVSMQLDSPFCF